MTVRFLSTDEPWTLWNPNPGDPSYGANFYTSVEPYLRKRATITHMKLAGDVERRMANEGYVGMDKLPKHVVEYWAEADANWLVADVLRHLASK